MNMCFRIFLYERVRSFLKCVLCVCCLFLSDWKAKAIFKKFTKQLISLYISHWFVESSLCNLISSTGLEVWFKNWGRKRDPATRNLIWKGFLGDTSFNILQDTGNSDSEVNFCLHSFQKKNGWRSDETLAEVEATEEEDLSVATQMSSLYRRLKRLKRKELEQPRIAKFTRRKYKGTVITGA